jgi:hypothetical protein
MPTDLAREMHSAAHRRSIATIASIGPARADTRSASQRPGAEAVDDFSVAGGGGAIHAPRICAIVAVQTGDLEGCAAL